MAETPELGPCVAIYRGRGFRPVDLLTLFLPGAAAIGLPLGYALLRVTYAYSHFGPVAAAAWSQQWFGLAILAAVVFAILFLYRLAVRFPIVALHQNGLRVRLRPFGERKLLYGELAGIAITLTAAGWPGRSGKTHLRATIVPNVGKPILLENQVQALPELVSRLKARLYPRLLAEMQAGLEKGQWLHFGPLAIHQSGLRVSGCELKWEQVGRLDVQAGWLQVELAQAGGGNGGPGRTAGPAKPHRIAVGQIPNFELLIQLIQGGVKA